ncbi:MAG: anthranilate synthase component I, partial [Gemmatimonadaceae bacterium]
MPFEAFNARVQRGHLVPVWRECVLDTETPVAAFTKLKRGPFSFLLESAPAGSETWSRYTFMGTEPRGAWRLSDGRVEDWTADAGWHHARTPADPLADLEQRLREFPPVEVPELGEFWGGAVGYFGYDVVRCIERLPNAPPRTLDAPDALFVFTNVL